MIRLNPNLENDLRRSADMRAALARKAAEVAQRAQTNGRQVADSYTAEVDNTVQGVQVVANTDGINAASWIEYGTGGQTPTPAYAPLRRAVEAVGLKFTVYRRRI